MRKLSVFTGPSDYKIQYKADLYNEIFESSLESVLKAFIQFPALWRRINKLKFKKQVFY